jgi:hypothetical protein
MKKLCLICGLAALSLTAFSLHGEDPAKKEEQPSFWMKKKLEYSEKILEGLTAADFEAISKNAKMMGQLNAIEDFVRGRDESYEPIANYCVKRRKRTSTARRWPTRN